MMRSQFPSISEKRNHFLSETIGIFCFWVFLHMCWGVGLGGGLCWHLLLSTSPWAGPHAGHAGAVFLFWLGNGCPFHSPVDIKSGCMDRTPILRRIGLHLCCQKQTKPPTNNLLPNKTSNHYQLTLWEGNLHRALPWSEDLPAFWCFTGLLKMWCLCGDGRGAAWHQGSPDSLPSQ